MKKTREKKATKLRGTKSRSRAKKTGKAKQPKAKLAASAKSSKKTRLTRKPAIVSAKKPKRSPLKVVSKPSKASLKPLKPRSHQKPSRTTAKVGRPSPRTPAKPSRTTAKVGRPSPRTPAKPVTKKRPKLSRSPAAIRARKRRADRKAQKQQLIAEASRLAPPQGGDERRLMWGWLEMIRDRLADVFPLTLTITELGGGHATLEGRDAARHREARWQIVGRYDPKNELDYQTLGAGLLHVADDLFIEASVHPQRLSQLRVEFHDPDDTRREGDTVLSKIGPWEFVLSDLAFELVGARAESPSEDSLAARYQNTIVPRFYIFFSSELLATRTIKWGK